MAERSFEAVGLRVVDPSVARSASDAPAMPAFNEVYERYFAFVWSAARRFGIEPSAMDDLVQEVFIVIHSRLHTLQKPEAVRSWIYSVVRRTASSHRRARRPTVALSSDNSAPIEALSRDRTPLEQTERNAELQLLMSLLDALDEPKREIFALVEIDELSVPEAAEILELPLNTAYSRLRAARQMFEAALERHEARNKGK